MHNVWIHFIHAKNTACFKLKCHFHPRKPSLLSWYQAQYHINLSYLNQTLIVIKTWSTLVYFQGLPLILSLNTDFKGTYLFDLGNFQLSKIETWNIIFALSKVETLSLHVPGQFLFSIVMIFLLFFGLGPDSFLFYVNFLGCTCNKIKMINIERIIHVSIC